MPSAPPPAAAPQDFDLPVRTRRPLVDAEMDITPMIDCVFLLLIFFIVCSTMDPGASVELAQARHGKGVSERESIVLTVASGGVDAAPIYLGDGLVGDPLDGSRQDEAELIGAYVAQQMADKQFTDVLIKADRHVAHRDVARAIRGASRADGVELHLAVIEVE